MIHLKMLIDSLTEGTNLSQLLIDSLKVVMVDPLKIKSPSLFENPNFYTLIGATIATITAFGVLFIKEFFDYRKQKRTKRENIFSEFTNHCYKITISSTHTESFSSEQEFYLAMANATQEKEARDVYLFMYKDNAEKYAMAYKEFVASFSDFNKVIASYVILTNDKSIAEDINKLFLKVSSNIDFVYPTKDTKQLQEFRSKYQEEINKAHLVLTEKLNHFRERVYKHLGFTYRVV